MQLLLLAITDNPVHTHFIHSTLPDAKKYRFPLSIAAIIMMPNVDISITTK